MKQFLLFTTLISFFILNHTTAQEVKAVAQFNRVIISPHVQATFIKGNKESVTIESCTVGKDKINVESNGKTLRVYLEGAKEITKNNKEYENGHQISKSLYKGTVLIVTVTYKTLDELSVRGEETILLKSKLDQADFGLTVYGTGKVYINEVQLAKMHTTMYGESDVEIKSGNVDEHKFTSYGESKVNALQSTSKVVRATLYGESQINVKVSDLIKVTCFGEARVNYIGDPEIKKGITIGKSQITRIN